MINVKVKSSILHGYPLFLEVTPFWHSPPFFNKNPLPTLSSQFQDVLPFIKERDGGVPTKHQLGFGTHPSYEALSNIWVKIKKYTFINNRGDWGLLLDSDPKLPVGQHSSR